MTLISHGKRAGFRGVFAPVLLATTALTGIPKHAMAAETTIETVVVTAEKRAEDIQKVPFSILALGNVKLQQLQVTNFSDYVRFLPSVEYTVGQPSGGGNGGPGFATVSMRGVTSGNDGNHSGPLPTVGIYLDEAPITTIGGALDLHIYDVARVEQLAGPQGTLYGASSEAGTIRIITNQPDTTAFSAAYQVRANSTEHGGLGGSVEGYVNVPIEDNMAIRLVAWDEHDAGFIDNVPGTRTYPTSGITINNSATAASNYNYVDTAGARAALKIDLDNDWTVTPTLMGQNEDSHGINAYDPSVGFLKVKHFQPEMVHDYWYQAGLTVQGKIGNLDLTYAGSHMDRWIHEQSDYTDYSFWYDVLYGYGAFWYDNSGNPIDPSQHITAQDHFTKDTHEIRIASPTDQPFRWIAGAFYERQGHWIFQNYQIPGLADALQVPGWPNTIWLTDQERVDTDVAGFGEISYDILPNLTLTGGGRVFYAHNALRGFFGFGAGYSSHTGVSQCFATPVPVVHNGPCTDLDASVSESGWTHKLSLKWQVDDDRMVYATWSTGFRPGGINRRASAGPYAPDTLDNYEIGWKTAWLDNSVTWNGALFWEDWNRFQYPFLDANSFTVIQNAGNASIKGLETNFDWQVDSNFTLDGALTFADGHLLEDYCGLQGVHVCPGPLDPDGPDAPKGTQLPGTPKYKGNLTGRYQFHWNDFLVHLQAAGTFQSSVWSDLRDQATSPPTGLKVPIRAALGKQPSYATVDLSVGIENDSYALELSAQNVFDTAGQAYRFAECTPQICLHQPYIVPIHPRMVQLTFSQKFD